MSLRIQGIIQTLLIMSVLWRKIEFYEGVREKAIMKQS